MDQILTHGSLTDSLDNITPSIVQRFVVYFKVSKQMPSKSGSFILLPIASRMRFKSFAFFFLSKLPLTSTQFSSHQRKKNYYIVPLPLFRPVSK